MEKTGKNRIRLMAVLGSIGVVLVLVLGLLWMGISARRDTEKAVRSVSLLYLDELAGRRQQVVSSKLQDYVQDMKVAIGMMNAIDLSDVEHLQQYQARMKKLYALEKFAFVDTEGRIYTSLGMQDDIDEYQFDYKTISGSEISIKNVKTREKTVIIAVPVEGMKVGEETLKVCFLEISMTNLLEDISLKSDNNNTTFVNIYTRDGVALTDMVLGGLASEDNLIAAMGQASYEEGYSQADFEEDFREGRGGVVSFTYGDVRETLSYVPVEGTDWMLTYLIRESVISDSIGSVSDRIIIQSVIQSGLTALILLGMFIFILKQTRRTARVTLEKETAEVENRVKQHELEERLKLQEQRLELQEQLVERSQALSEALAVAEEANKAKTVFLSNMSHEIRTPMNAIIGLDNIALNDPETPEKTREYLEKIGESAKHLLTIINDILDMSRIESGRMTLTPEEFSFPKLLEQVNAIFSSQCREKGLNYDCRIVGQVDDYYIGDNTKLRQVLINILSNAVKFTPEGGSINLTAEKTAAFDGKSTLKFVISDTGIGMSKEYLPRLFDTFSQEDSGASNKYGSSGLGMAITKSIVEMMNGQILVESEKGVGTTFTVVVTLNDSDRTGMEMADLPRPEEMTVLVVDDDPVACENAKVVLGQAGINTETAASGQKAVEMVRLRHARREPYNLILVDWQMPEMDGVETTRQIRAMVGHESAIIILTAYNWDDVLEEAIEAGVDSFIAKPLFATNVMGEFRTALERKGLDGNEEKHKAELAGRRILLAEDMLVNAEIMKMVLEMREMQVDHAENGRVALEKFSGSPEGYYSAILMDMRMPEMDGLTATREIRALDREDAKEIPIIALTANAFDEDVQRSLQAGLNAHLSKPVEPDLLFETLESLIPD